MSMQLTSGSGERTFLEAALRLNWGEENLTLLSYSYYIMDISKPADQNSSELSRYTENYLQILLYEGKCDEGTLQWNRGHLAQIEDYLNQLAESTDGVNLKWECKEHTFGYDDWKRQLEYRTVQVVFDN